MTPPAAPPVRRSRAATFVSRAAAFLALWLVLAGTAMADTAFGVAASCVAAWASVALLPPGATRLRPVALAAYVPHFLWQSIRGGWDVAWRALQPGLPLAPGFVDYRPRLSPGPARQFVASLSSLLPGTVPVADDGQRLRYHCLDTQAPVAEALAAEEGEFSRVLGTGDTDETNRGGT
jgi:multicomponent Na+:H+ antiporter subunit E